MNPEAIIQQQEKKRAEALSYTNAIKEEKIYREELRLILWQMKHARKYYDEKKHESIYHRWFALNERI